jgi:uncharacterized membrane protein
MFRAGSDKIFAPLEEVLRYSIPELHPLAVHFPVVLILVAAGFALLWLVRDRKRWLSLALWTESLGFIGSGAAYLSGESMKQQSEGVPVVEELIRMHEQAALYSLILVGASVILIALARVVLDRDDSRPGVHPFLRVLVAIFALVAAVLIAWTGHVGATMVWGVAS